MNDVFLILGSNLGSRMLFLEKALILLEDKVGKIILSSSIYETEPWGFNSDNRFLNQVVKMRTAFLPQPLLDNILLIEMALERSRNNDGNYQARTIDIDILFYNNEVIDEDRIKIPHHFIADRRFVLTPMNEIASDYVHPQLNLPIAHLLRVCPDNSKVVLYSKK